MIMRLLRFLRAITETESQQDTSAVESCLNESPATAHVIEEIEAFWYHPQTDKLHPKHKWKNPKGTHSDAVLDDLNIPELAGYKNTGPDDFYVLEMAMIQGWVRGVNFDGGIILQGINETAAINAFRAVAPHFDKAHVKQVSLVGWLDNYERVIRAIDIDDFTGDE
jgi:hypothetical protein